jgi:flavin reductase (DIM6/NTAB) family NADH-FMN oxidoreductase RutF
MAAQVPHSSCLVLDGARHMMNLTHPDAVNHALDGLLKTPFSNIDPKVLRAAFGTFMTGVTVVTTRAVDGTMRGFTANSFSSVSLDPPLLLVCLSKAAASCAVFAEAAHFAVNILAENQKDVSGIFASKRPDKFETTAWTESASGNALITGAVAWFDCSSHQVVEAGDHLILIGRVQSFSHSDVSPLGYARGGYFTLGLEQSVVNAVSSAGRTEVGAILECGGELLVMPGPTPGSLILPRVGDGPISGSASSLLASLSSKGLHVTLGFLYAVFENPETKTQSIYYRGEAEAQGTTRPTTVSFDDMPWERFTDSAVVSMLRRYCTERVQGRYRIYSGDHRSGETRELHD